MLQGANLLLLDEPTNHLDIPSKEVFEDAILNFTGTAIIVSHDRYLLSKIPDKIVELTNNGCRIYLGKYDFYMEKKAAEEQRYVTDANLKNRVSTDVDSGGVFCGDERDGLNREIDVAEKFYQRSRKMRRIGANCHQRKKES